MIGGIWVIRNDDGVYDANYEALLSDLGEIDEYYLEKDYTDEIGEEIASPNGPRAVIWYRGGPGDTSEQQEYIRPWTEAEIDNYHKALESGCAVLLVSQAHGFDKGAFLSSTYASGWEDWYGFTILNGQLATTQARQMWAHGMTGGRGVTGTGHYGYLASEPLGLATSGAVGGKGPTDGYDADGARGAEFYNGPGGSGDIPIELSFGEGYQVCGLGYYSGLMLFDKHPVAAEGFRPGLNLVPAFEDIYDLAFVSWGSTAAPNRNMGVYSQEAPWVNTADHGNARLWVIGYPWAQVQTVKSMNGGMPRSYLLLNILAWLVEGSMYPSYQSYSGKPEIVQVMVGQWEAGGFHVDAVSNTWDGAAGDYPDQTADPGYDVNVYRTTPPDTGNYVVTSSPNNDWVNGNDVDFQFPWYAYIVDVNGDGVQLGQGNNVDDTVCFAGLLLEDPDSSWARDLSLDYYSPTHSNNNVPSVVIDGFDPPVQVAGYYVSPSADSGDEVRAYYGAAPASVTVDNAGEITAECLAHWPLDLVYGGFDYPTGSGRMLPVSAPVLYWSMYPGHNMTDPGTGLQIPYATPDGWGTYRHAFDIDPTVSVPVRDAGDSWNRPRFAFHEAASSGRVVTFDYRQVPNWNPDLNRDGAIDNLDKFPVRVRLFTDHEDYVKWDTGWPDHLQDPGFDPELGGPIWDPEDPGHNIPDYIEGGAYIADEGSEVRLFMLIDDPAQPDPHEMVSGGSGNYLVTFIYIIVDGVAPYDMEFNLGYDPSYSGLGDPFDMTGSISMDTAIHGANGPHSFTAGFNVPDGDHWAAARATDFTGDQRVYMWPLSKVPCYPEE